MNSLLVTDMIKQRPPFLMIDKLLERVYGEYAIGKKNISYNEPYLQGHFPEFAIMPGVLIIECMAQLSSMIFYNGKNNLDKFYVLLKVDSVKFIKAVLPGDVLIIKSKVIIKTDEFIKVEAKVESEGIIVAKGQLSFGVVYKEKLLNN